MRKQLEWRTCSSTSSRHYKAEVQAMEANGSSTMFIDFSHVMLYNDILQKAIADEYLR